MCSHGSLSFHTSITAVLPTVQEGRLNNLVKACLPGTRGCQWNHKQGNHFREPEGKRNTHTASHSHTVRSEAVSGFRSQAILSEWMRMPNMSHRAPTLNSEKETSRKSFSFWQSVIVRAPRSYLCATVLTVQAQMLTHTHTHIQQLKKKKNL